jgi:hypothetical protein
VGEAGQFRYDVVDPEHPAVQCLGEEAARLAGLGAVGQQVGERAQRRGDRKPFGPGHLVRRERAYAQPDQMVPAGPPARGGELHVPHYEVAELQQHRGRTMGDDCAVRAQQRPLPGRHRRVHPQPGHLDRAVPRGGGLAADHQVDALPRLLQQPRLGHPLQLHVADVGLYGLGRSYHSPLALGEPGQGDECGATIHIRSVSGIQQYYLYDVRNEDNQTARR